jgi:hypothetical protein
MEIPPIVFLVGYRETFLGGDGPESFQMDGLIVGEHAVEVEDHGSKR